jgi:hypothetical protein
MPGNLPIEISHFLHPPMVGSFATLPNFSLSLSQLQDMAARQRDRDPRSKGIYTFGSGPSFMYVSPLMKFPNISLGAAKA